MCHRLEEMSQCIIHINKSLQRISVEGGASSLQLLKAKYTLSSQFFSLDPLTFTFPPSVLTRLLANNHERYNSLTQQCDAYLYLDYFSGTLSVYGEERQRQMAKVMIQFISHIDSYYEDH